QVEVEARLPQRVGEPQVAPYVAVLTGAAGVIGTEREAESGGELATGGERSGAVEWAECVFRGQPTGSFTTQGERGQVRVPADTGRSDRGQVGLEAAEPGVADVAGVPGVGRDGVLGAR